MKAQNIMKNENGLIAVTTSFNSEFVKKAKDLGGKWDAKNSEWIFDSTIEEYVKSLLLDIFGVTGESKYETCSLIIKNVTLEQFNGGIELFGRTIARAFGRDTGAKLGEGIVWVSGTKDSGGSVKNWNTKIENGTFEIQDFPVERIKFEDVQKAVAEGWCELKMVKKTRTTKEIMAEIAEHETKIIELKKELETI